MRRLARRCRTCRPGGWRQRLWEPEGPAKPIIPSWADLIRRDALALLLRQAASPAPRALTVHVVDARSGLPEGAAGVRSFTLVFAPALGFRRFRGAAEAAARLSQDLVGRTAAATAIGIGLIVFGPAWFAGILGHCRSRACARIGAPNPTRDHPAGSVPATSCPQFAVLDRDRPPSSGSPRRRNGWLYRRLA